MARTSRARRPRSGRTPRTRTSARTGVIEVFTRPEHSLVVRLLGLVVRLRAELTVIAILAIARFWVWPRLVELAGHTTALVVTVVLVVSVLVVPASRRFLSRRWWAVTTRHRMRACFLQTRTMTHHGKLPYLVWSRPSPVGEKVRVWLPAGLSVKDLERVTTETAAACWAADVRLTPSRRQAALVVVEVVRRDPLTGGALTPDVVDDLDHTDHTDIDQTDIDRTGFREGLDLVVDGASDTDTVGGSTDRGPGGTIVPLPSRTTPPPPPSARPDTGTDSGSMGRTGSRTRTRKNPAPAGTSASTTATGTTGTAGTGNAGEPPVTGFGGVDVSDYV